MKIWLNLPDIFDVAKTAFLDLCRAIVINSGDTTGFGFTLRAIELARAFVFQWHFIADTMCVLGTLAIFMCIVVIDVLLLACANAVPISDEFSVHVEVVTKHQLHRRGSRCCVVCAVNSCHDGCENAGPWIVIRSHCCRLGTCESCSQQFGAHAQLQSWLVDCVLWSF